MKNQSVQKYIDLFDKLYKQKGPKYAIDYMGIYFLGLMDNVPYEYFIENLYDGFVTFTDWLFQGAEKDLWQSLYKWDPYREPTKEDFKNMPLIFKLVESIDGAIEEPEDVNVAISNAYNSLSKLGEEELGNIANFYLDKEKALTISVDVWSEAGKPLYNFDDKLTKKAIKEDRATAYKTIVESLALVLAYGGTIFYNVKDKNTETISALAFQNDNIYVVPASELKKCMTEYIKLNKDKSILFEEYKFVKRS